MKKQDRQGARTVTDLERRYDLGGIPNAIESATIAQRSAEEAKAAADEAKAIFDALSSLVQTGDGGVPYISGSSIRGIISSVDGVSVVVDLDTGLVSIPSIERRIEAAGAQSSYTAMMTDTLIAGTLTKDKISTWYTLSLWSETMIQSAVDKGVLSADEATEILSEGGAV